MNAKEAYEALILGKLSRDYGPAYSAMRYYVLRGEYRNLVRDGQLTEEDSQLIEEANRYEKKIQTTVNASDLLSYENIYDLLLKNELLLYWYSPKSQFTGFRGQADASWSLTPTLFRDVSRIRDHMGLTGVAAECLALERGPLSKLSPIEILAVLQHYGFPTFLLDFTEDIRIAAAFACREYRVSKGRKEGVIIKIYPEEYSKLSKYFSTILGEQIIVKLPQIHRIEKQKGFFFGYSKVSTFEKFTSCTRYVFKHGPESATFQEVTGLTDSYLFPEDDLSKTIDTYADSLRKRSSRHARDLNSSVAHQLYDLLNQAAQHCTIEVSADDYMDSIKTWIEWDALEPQKRLEIQVLVRWFLKLDGLPIPSHAKSLRRLLYGVLRIWQYPKITAQKATDIFDRVDRKQKPHIQSLLDTARTEVKA